MNQTSVIFILIWAIPFFIASLSEKNMSFFFGILFSTFLLGYIGGNIIEKLDKIEQKLSKVKR